MFKTGFILSTDEHIAAAIHNQTPVTVWMEGKIVDYGGVIERQTERSVRINGEWHPKPFVDGDQVMPGCEFRVK